MNIQLVESLVNAIKSLSLEEQELLGKKTQRSPLLGNCIRTN
ncbi:hypothetical protein [Microcystis aeruginosa]|nr:hypothetical protein [Microcystis aeruginosa]CCI09283.1 hypothetical protein MICAD_420012 [Microcystis aeruginosa PCC 7941]